MVAGGRRKSIAFFISLGIGLILVGTAFNVFAVVTIDRGLKRTYTFDGMEWMKWKREYAEDGEIAKWFNDKDRKSTRLNSSHLGSRMPSSA